MRKILMILAWVLPAATCSAQVFLPLEPGNFWSYRLDDESLETRLVGDEVMFQGRLVFPIHYVTSPSNQGLVNYWTAAPNGGVLLHGFTRDVTGVFYDPPLLFADATLTVGQSWSQQVDFYILPQGTYYGRWDCGVEVLAEEVRSVPAGNFASFGLRDWAYGPPKSPFAGAYNLCGEAVGAKEGLVERWLAQDVGIVEEARDGTFRLVAYTDHPVAVSSMSWGAVKALFRE